MYTATAGPAGATDVACFHGGTGTGGFHWGRVAGALEDGYRLHLPDLPGHGRTPLPAGGAYDADVLVGAVTELLERLGPPVHVMGFSMGGNAALALAGRRPELFASLVLVGVSVRHHAGLDGWRHRFDPDRLQEKYPLWAKRLSRLHEPLGGPDAWRDVCVRDAAGVDHDIEVPALERLDCPVLLVRGDRDPAVDAAQYAELRERLGEQGEELVVPAGGHEVQMTRHELVTAALQDFLGRIRA